MFMYILRGIVVAAAIGYMYYTVKSTMKNQKQNVRQQHKCFICKEYGFLDTFVEMNCGHFKHTNCSNNCPCSCGLIKEMCNCIICKQDGYLDNMNIMNCGHVKHPFCHGVCHCLLED